MATLEFECRNCYNTITIQIVSAADDNDNNDNNTSNNNITAFWNDKYWIVASGYGSFMLYQKTNDIIEEDQSNPAVLNFECPLCNSKLYIDIISFFPVTSSKKQDDNNKGSSSWIVDTIVGKLSIFVNGYNKVELVS